MQLESAEATCLNCGKPKDEWTLNRGHGVIRHGRPYCCKGCAELSGCECDAA